MSNSVTVVHACVLAFVCPSGICCPQINDQLVVHYGLSWIKSTITVPGLSTNFKYTKLRFRMIVEPNTTTTVYQVIAEMDGATSPFTISVPLPYVIQVGVLFLHLFLHYCVCLELDSYSSSSAQYRHHSVCSWNVGFVSISSMNARTHARTHAHRHAHMLAYTHGPPLRSGNMTG